MTPQAKSIVPGQVSCVIPYGGAAKYLEETVRSAADQHFGEIIIVNDGQPPEQLAAVVTLAGVRVVELEKRSGASHARNVGIKACRTPYVTLLDGDDILCRSYLGAMTRTIAESGLRCAAAALSYIGEDSRRIGRNVSRYHNVLLPSGFISEVALLAEVGYFPESISEDFLLFRNIRKITSLTVCPAAQVLYRIHGQSASSTRGRAQWAFGQLVPLYDRGEISLEEANTLANQFADRGTIPPGLEPLFEGARYATARLLGRTAYACWLNRDFLHMAECGVRLLPYVPDLLHIAKEKWRK